MKKLINRVAIGTCFACFLQSSPAKAENALNDVLNTSIVRIAGPAANGSGVIVGKAGNTYLLLTAKHVVGNLTSEEADVISSNGKNERLKIIKAFAGSDLAIGSFKSDITYIPIPINEFLPSPPPPVTFNGSLPFSVEQGPRNKFMTVSAAGRVAGYSLPTKAIKIPIFRVIDADLVDIVSGNTDGYDLIYQASTVPGMSGGAVVGFRDCTNGGGFALGVSSYSVFPTLVGVHGRSEEYAGGSGRSGISLGVPIKGEILAFLKSVSTQYGIPVGEKSLRPSINHKFCTNKPDLESILKESPGAQRRGAPMMMPFGNPNETDFFGGFGER